MIKKTLLCLAVAGFVFTPAMSRAALYNDLNTYGLTGFGVTSSTPLVDQFDIGPFASSSEVATGGLATFTIADFNLFDKETYSVNIGSQNFSGTFQFGVVLAGGLLNGDLLLSLTQNHGGTVSYSITSKSGDFRVLSADLLVSTTEGGHSQSVPDGGATLALLGFGVIGLYGLHRRYCRFC